MPTNQEWLHKLANESPDELKAWFDAEHNDNLAAEKVVSGDAAHSNDANADLKASEDLSDAFSDSRAQLESLMLEKLELQQRVDELQEQVMEKHYELKDANAANKRQSEKIEGVCRLNDELQRKVDELTDSYEASSRALEILTLDKAKLATQVDKLQSYVDDATADYAKLVKERDNLAADLLTCNREREQLRKHLGIALDHAHDICSLVDIDGNVLDVGD